LDGKRKPGAEELVYNDILSYIGLLKPRDLATATAAAFYGHQNITLITRCFRRNQKQPCPKPVPEKQNAKKSTGQTTDPQRTGQPLPNYQSKRNANKVVLGLLVYQGLTVHDLQQLKPENIHLAEGKIYIPGTRKSNSRWLRLKAFQIISLQEYIKQTRPEIIKKTGTKSDKLIIGEKGSNELKARLMDLFAELRKLNPKAENAAQVRSSVLVEKLKTTGLRETQYFAGHKYVSSTERYKLGDIENLKKQIEKHHPLRGL
jgi:integrase